MRAADDLALVQELQPTQMARSYLSKETGYVQEEERVSVATREIRIEADDTPEVIEQKIKHALRSPVPWDLDGACICGHQGRRHYAPSGQYPYTCSLCSCMYFQTPPIGETRPIEEQLADAIRCTTHIDDRILRARYVLKDLELRGVIVQQVARDSKGHFTRLVTPSKREESAG